MRRIAAIILALLFCVPATAQTPAPYDYTDLATAPFSMGVQNRFGELTYAGGLYLTAPKTERFGGVSGLEAEDGPPGEVRFTAVGDAGDFIMLTGRLDANGRLVGAGDLATTALRDVTGDLLVGKREGDAEDITRPPDSAGWLISFEQRHRIVAYADPFNPKAEVFGVNVPAAAKTLPPNAGMEALAALPGGRLVVGGEYGRMWLCPPGHEPCKEIHGPGGMGFLFYLTGLDYLPGSTDELVATYRRPSPVGGFASIIAHVVIRNGTATVRALAELPTYVDNVEGIAALASPAGGYRLYVVTDNNFFPGNQTRLLAFDWKSALK